MDKRDINKRVLEFLNRVGKIRGENTLFQAKIMRRKGITLSILLGACLVSFLVIAYTKSDDTPSLPAKTKKVLTSQKDTSQKTNKVLLKEPITHPSKSALHNPVKQKKLEPELIMVEPIEKKPTDAEGAAIIKKPFVESIIEANSKASALGIKETEKSTDSASQQTFKVEENKMMPNIMVSDIAVCKDISERNPVERQHTFSLEKDGFAVIWTEIKTKTIPRQIRHIYHFKGKKIMEVRLKVEYPRTRTWSRLTLRNQSQIGLWNVTVVQEDGEILERAEFEINP